MAGPGAQKFPFRGNSRQRFQRVAQVGFTPGGRLSIELPRVGYVAGILVQLAFNVTRTAGDTGALSDQMANILRRMQLNLNVGASTIFDCSGHGTNLLNQAMSFNYAMDLGGQDTGVPAPLEATADPALWDGAATVPETAKQFGFTYWLPVAMNDGLNFNIGLINLQAPEIRATLDLAFGDVADLFEPGSVLTGTSIVANSGVAVIHYLYYEVPNPDLVQIPPYVVHRVLQERQAIQAVGDQVYTVPRMGQLQRLIHSVQINGVTNTGLVQDLVIRVNKTDEIYRTQEIANRFLSRMRYGHTVPRGAFYHDWWRAADLNGSGDFRDVIDSEQISTLESIVTIASTATLGSGNNFLDSIREFTQRLA